MTISHEIPSETRILRDYFNLNSFLAVDKMVGHDMHIQSGNLESFTFGPAVRVYNFRGSGSYAYDTIYQYLSAMSDHYGTKGVPSLAFNFGAPEVPALNKPKEVSILDTPEWQCYMRIITATKFFGFQTYQITELGNRGIAEGPIVWFDKYLPKVKAEAQALTHMLKVSNPKPFELEIVS